VAAFVTLSDGKGDAGRRAAGGAPQEAELRAVQGRRQGLADLGTGAELWGLLCAGFVGYAITALLLLAWVARDARSRGMEVGARWVLGILMTHFVGLLIYLAVRPRGTLVPCARCGYKRLQAAPACPHCGQAVAAA
jgi:hypothetical protein